MNKEMHSDDEFDANASFENQVIGGNANDEDPITEEDAWTVISANFQEKGLVRQQLDSFDMFMTTTMQVCSFNSSCLAISREALGPLFLNVLPCLA